MTVVMTALFTNMTAADPVNGPAMAFTAVMLGGVLQVVMGYLRMGSYISFVPLPVVSGFMSGIGVIIILLQLAPLVGQPAIGRPLEVVQHAGSLFAGADGATLVVAALSLIIVYATPRQLGRVIPSPLLALLVGSLVVAMLPALHDVATLGEIPSGLPTMHMPMLTLEHLPQILRAAVVLALLGSIDTLLTSLVADNLTRTWHDSNRELIGQGVGNAIAGVLGGLPGAGATMRTVVNIRAGGLTPISGALHALLLLAIVLGLGGAAAQIPHAVLAGILIKVGTDIIDWDYLRRIRRSSRTGVLIMLVVLFTTIFVDLITAVAVGMVMASLVFLKRHTDLQLESIRLIDGESGAGELNPVEQALFDRARGHVLLFQFGSAISFGSAKALGRMLAQNQRFRVTVLDFTMVPEIDGSAVRVIEEDIRDAGRQERVVLLAGMSPRVKLRLRREGVLSLLPPRNRCRDRVTALERAAQLAQDDEA
jgi:SulP family sulfate permease